MVPNWMYVFGYFHSQSYIACTAKLCAVGCSRSGSLRHGWAILKSSVWRGDCICLFVLVLVFLSGSLCWNILCKHDLGVGCIFLVDWVLDTFACCFQFSSGNGRCFPVFLTLDGLF